MMKKNGRSAAELADEGKKYMAKGNFRKAEKIFADALTAVDDAPTRNNLATAIFLGGDPRRALDFLEPVLKEAEKEGPGAINTRVNPYTYALASRICRALGDTEAARRHLNQAVRSFEEGLAFLRRSLPLPELTTFLEYTVAIMQAAADLQDHRQVFELYRRWESAHVRWENRHLAAVACFNLGRYKRAAGLWASLTAEHRIFADLQKTAFLLERGVVPPFPLGYEIPSRDKLETMFKEAIEKPEARHRLLEDGYLRIFFLTQALEENASPNNNQAAYNLVYYGGEWGTALGQSILNSPGFSPEAKLGAAQALLGKGVFKEREPIPMYIDGKRREVRLMNTVVILDQDEKLDETVSRARELHKAGRLDEAIAVLQELYFEEGKLYPPAVINLANYLREKNELEQARTLMEMLLKFLPAEPAVIFNYSALLLQMGQVKEAREYFKRLKSLGRDVIAEMGAEFKQKMAVLEAQISLHETSATLSDPAYPATLARLFEERQRQAIEEKPLPADPSLSRGLKNMPVNWLEAALAAYGLPPARHRREKEEQLKNFLTRRENLEKVVQEVGDEDRELLKFLLSRGGFSRISAVTRKFGTTDGDGFFWEEEEPASPLGLLWSRALVMVGKAVLNNRQCKIAAIPVELRPLLKEILNISK